MLSVSKHVVENDMSFFMKVNGCHKSSKRIRVVRYSLTSQNNVKNEQHKHQVKIYTVVTLLYYKTDTKKDLS